MDAQLNTAGLIQELNNKGVVIIDSYVKGKQLEELNKEFAKFLEKETKGVVFTPYSHGKGARVKRVEYDKSEFPATTEFFYTEAFNEIAKAYLKAEVNLNEELFIVKDVVGSKHIANDLHYDVVSTFKFFLYLTDTTAENGAFTCVPGSHKKTAEYRKRVDKNISYENRDITRELDLDAFPPAVPIEGKAGSLIIFDTDVWHQAGTVSRGERHVMRGHTRVREVATAVKSADSWMTRIKKIFS